MTVTDDASFLHTPHFSPLYNNSRPHPVGFANIFFINKCQKLICTPITAYSTKSQSAGLRAKPRKCHHALSPHFHKSRHSRSLGSGRARLAALDGLAIVGFGCRRAPKHPGWQWHYVGSASLVQRRCGVAPDGDHCGNSREISGKPATGIDRNAREILRNVTVRWLAQKTAGYVLLESYMRLRARCWACGALIWFGVLGFFILGQP